MALTPEQKQAAIGNCNQSLVMAREILSTIDPKNGTPSKEEFKRLLIASILSLTISIATAAQVYISSSEESVIFKPSN